MPACTAGVQSLPPARREPSKGPRQCWLRRQAPPPTPRRQLVRHAAQGYGVAAASWRGSLARYPDPVKLVRRQAPTSSYGARLLPQLLAANSSVMPPRDTVLPRRVGGGAWLGTPVPRSCQTRPASGTDIGARRVRGERASSVGPLVHQSIHADRAWRRAARSEQSKQRRCAHAWGVLAPARRRGRSCAHVLARTLDVRAVRALGVFGAF
jgi:hypothetical protein